MSNTAASTAQVNATTNTIKQVATNASTNISKMTTKGISATGIVLAVTGVLAIIGASLFQYFSIDHGTSSQSTIDNGIKKSFAIILTTTLLIVIGAGMYYYINTSERPFLILFFVCMLSFILSNIAVILSLYQVHVG